MTLTKAALVFFGKPKDVKLMEFTDEVSRLDPDDRKELANLLAIELGEEVSP